VLINPAWAQAPAAAPQGGGIESMLLILAMFAVLYFLMIRPQMKRAKEHKAMVDALQKGDEVVTAGGILGRITHVDPQYAKVSVSDNTEIVIQRHSIQVVLPKGTLKTIE
jgi:preprotein translocase subunit YajC